MKENNHLLLHLWGVIKSIETEAAFTKTMMNETLVFFKVVSWHSTNLFMQFFHESKHLLNAFFSLE